MNTPHLPSETPFCRTYAHMYKDTALRPGWRNRVRSVILYGLGMLPNPSDGGKNWIRPIYGHQIYDDKRDNFDEILNYCRNRAEFISSSQLIEILQDDGQIDGRYYHLSFDDGLASVFENGLPLFRKYDISPTFFINPASIDMDFEYTRDFQSERLNLPRAVRVLRWAELNEAVSEGIEVGCHTMTHACLSSISSDSDMLETEIVACKSEIEKNLGQPCRWFAWPYGQKKHIDEVSLRKIKEAGFDACFSAIRGTISSKGVDLFTLPRHQIEDYFPLAHARVFARGGFET